MNKFDPRKATAARRRINLLAATMLCSFPGTATAAQAGDPMVARVQALEQMVQDLREEVAALRRAGAASPAAQPGVATAAANPPPPPPSQVATEAEGISVADTTGSTRAPHTDTAVASNQAVENDAGSTAPVGFPIGVFGTIQYHFGYVENPGVPTDNLGYNGRARRLVIGLRGELPGDIRYNLEVNLAQGDVDYEDVTLSWEPDDSPVSVKLGYFYPFSGLENLTSSRRTSFVERAQMTDAFGLGRRIGGAIGLVNEVGDLRLNAGLFNGGINSSSTNTDWQTAIRGVWSPELDGNQLHVAASHQYRRTRRPDQSFLYQARPFTQVTSIRFVGTGPASDDGAIEAGIASKGDQIFGVEAAAIVGPLHLASEAQHVAVDAIRPGEQLARGRTTSGQRLASDPEFFSVYGEVGYWLTGETRGYSDGRFHITKVLAPIDKGGIGAFQLVGRIDYLDLTSRVGGAGMGIVDGVLNGGTQTGYLIALNWWPSDALRFTAQYTRGQIVGGPSAGQIEPLGGDPLYDRDFGYDAVIARAQVEF